MGRNKFLNDKMLVKDINSFLSSKSHLTLEEVGQYLIINEILDVNFNFLTNNIGYKKFTRYISELILTKKLSVFITASFIKLSLDSQIIKMIIENMLNYLEGTESKKVFNITGDLSIDDKSNINKIVGFSCRTPNNFIFDDILLSKAELDKLFNQPTDQTAPLQAEIDRLIAENQQQADTIRQLNERLEAGTPAEPIADNTNSRSQDDKLIVAMALLLAEKSNKFTRANKPNANQIGIAVTGMADYLLEQEDKYGLTTPDQRIRKALSNTIELIKK